MRARFTSILQQAGAAIGALLRGYGLFGGSGVTPREAVALIPTPLGPAIMMEELDEHKLDNRDR